MGIQDSTMEPDYQHYHSTTVMMLARSKINRRPQDPYYGYRDLARFVHDGIKEPFDYKDLYLRLLAACRAERTPLPTLGHMQALMSMVWDETAIPVQYQKSFHQVCHHVNEVLCYEIGAYATDSMKALAATLRVDLQVSLGYQNEPAQAPATATAPAPAPATSDLDSTSGSSRTLH